MLSTTSNNMFLKTDWVMIVVATFFNPIPDADDTEELVFFQFPFGDPCPEKCINILFQTGYNIFQNDVDLMYKMKKEDLLELTSLLYLHWKNPMRLARGLGHWKNIHLRRFILDMKKELLQAIPSSVFEKYNSSDLNPSPPNQSPPTAQPLVENCFASTSKSLAEIKKPSTVGASPLFLWQLGLKLEEKWLKLFQKNQIGKYFPVQMAWRVGERYL